MEKQFTVQASNGNQYQLSAATLASAKRLVSKSLPSASVYLHAPNGQVWLRSYTAYTGKHDAWRLFLA